MPLPHPSSPLGKNHRILIVDDNESIHEDFRKILAVDDEEKRLDAEETALFGAAHKHRQHIAFDLAYASQGVQALDLVRTSLQEGRRFALVFLDVRMPPGWDGLETAARIWEADPDLQVVICTAYSDKSWDEMMEKVSNPERVLILKKPFDTIEVLQLAYGLTEKWSLLQSARLNLEQLERTVSERTRELAQSEERFSKAFEYAPIGMALVSPEGRWLKVNRAICDLVGYSESELLSRTFQDITHPGDLEADLDHIRRMLAGEIRFYEIEKRYYHKNGHTVTVLLNVSLVRDAQERPLYFIAQIQDITQRQRNEEQLRLLSSAVEQTKESVLITNAELDLPGPRILFVNSAFTAITGYSADEVVGKTPRILQGPRTERSVLDLLRKTLGEKKAFQAETINYRKDGTAFDMEWLVAPLVNPQGNVTHFVAIQRDITERKRMQTQLFQSQKIEIVGKLAGGVAHEFNSIMTAIIGQSDLLINDLPPGDPLVQNAMEIRRCADRAALLTRQLLAFGRKQILQPETVDLNRILTDMEGIIRHLMGGDVDVRMVLANGLPAVKADTSQIEQVILNLIMNGREAMPHGGKLTLETSRICVDEEHVAEFADLKPGGYVLLAVTDTGVGMTSETKARVFEPFFSTKDVGQSTGLSLATCYGILKQSNGHITVYSELDLGTTFKIYLPETHEKTAATATVSRPPLDLPRGTETILLVEDDPALREMATQLLKRLGYTVLTAADSVGALALAEQQTPESIDLLFTDVVMPQLNGKDLSDRILEKHPRTKVLFTSAYPENAITHQGVLHPGVILLQKPFTPSSLAQKLRQVLDASPS
jgi:two-component system cell cycle sensor histidine kinase/response regulator CckA